MRLKLPVTAALRKIGATDRPLGAFEHHVIVAVNQLGPEQAYGLKIREFLAERTGRNATSGAVYVTLDRLEEKGLLLSQTTHPRPERGGRSRRTYAPTAAGVRALHAADSALAALAGRPAHGTEEFAT